MIVAFDTSSFVAYIQGESGGDVEWLEQLLEQGTLMLPPVVLAELLSDPKIPKKLENLLLRLPQVELLPGYWERAGKTRATLLSKKISGKRLKVKLSDALIAQCCLDSGLALISRDKDFRHFEKFAGLELLK